MPLLSVITSVYNETDSYIIESINSILNQTLSDFELIIVNDNPGRKGLDELMESFSDNRIRLYHNSENCGLAISMNRAAKYAKSDILVRMDADDVAELDRFEKQYKIYKTDNYDLIFSNFSRIDENSNIIDRAVNKKSSEGTELALKVALNPSIIHHPTVMMRKSLFDAVGGYRPYPCSQDGDLWLRMQENGCRFYYIGTPLLKYRVSSTSTTYRKWFLQRLTCHYFFQNSCDRLFLGKDDYSEENYHRYLKINGLNNPNAEKKYKRGQNFLSKAANSNGIKRLVLRILAFLSTPLLRKHFINEIRKRKYLRKNNIR